MSPEYRATLHKSQIMAGPISSNKQPLRLASLALAVLSVCLSIAVIGTAADAYSTYISQAEAGNPWWLPLWPGYFDTRGTKSQIGASVGVIILNGSFVLICLVPKLNFLPQSFRAMLIAVMISTASSLITLASVAYSAILNRSGRSRDTIQTWTCRFPVDIPAGGINLDGQKENMTNLSFSKMCTETKFAFWTLVTIVILQAILFSVAIAQWVMSFWSRTKREFEDERPDTGTEMESQRDLKISEEFPKQNY